MSDTDLLETLERLGPLNRWVPQRDIERRIGEPIAALERLRRGRLVEKVTIFEGLGARHYWRIRPIAD